MHEQHVILDVPSWLQMFRMLKINTLTICNQDFVFEIIYDSDPDLMDCNVVW